MRVGLISVFETPSSEQELVVKRGLFVMSQYAAAAVSMLIIHQVRARSSPLMLANAAALLGAPPPMVRPSPGCCRTGRMIRLRAALQEPRRRRGDALALSFSLPLQREKIPLQLLGPSEKRFPHFLVTPSLEKGSALWEAPRAQQSDPSEDGGRMSTPNSPPPTYVTTLPPYNKSRLFLVLCYAAS